MHPNGRRCALSGEMKHLPFTLTAPLLLALSVVAHDDHRDHYSTASNHVLEVPAGNHPTDHRIASILTSIQSSDADPLLFDALARAYIDRARATQRELDYALASAAVDHMAAHDGDPTEVLLLRGHILHNQHRFFEAEQVSRSLVTQRGAPRDYGLLSDALMEQGQLPQAAMACQVFLDLAPGFESYSRAAHLRWLTGDARGAIGLMEQAISAASGVSSNDFAWAITRLAFLHLQTGDAKAALNLADAALTYDDCYPVALTIKGRALLGLDRIHDSIAILERAAALSRQPETLWYLAEALRASGNTAQARPLESEIVMDGSQSDPRAVAQFLCTRAVAPDFALNLAEAEIENRRDPQTVDSLAFACFRSGDIPKANLLIAECLDTGFRSARVFLHAGLIAKAQGDEHAAAQHLRAASELAASLTPSELTILQHARRGGGHSA